MPQTSPSVLVIRLDAIGDALALTPLLEALRERAIPVDVVLSNANAGVFSSRAARAIFIAPFALRSSSAANRRAIAAFGEALRANGYSHALVATEDPSGYRLARASGARERSGFANGWGKPFKSLWVRTLIDRVIDRSAGLDPRAPHECDVLFELGRTLVGDAVPTRDPARLRPLVLERDPVPDRRIAFQVTDKWERLGIAFPEVVEAIASSSTIARVHPIASARESTYASAIEKATGQRVDVYGELEPWKEAIAEASALVAPDSGAVHLAGMVGTPTIAVFPPIAQFDLQSARWAPWAAPHRLLRADRDWPAQVRAALQALL